MDSHVAVVRCTDYHPDSVEAAVRRAVDLVGGIRQFVREGQRVLIKPNLLLASDPERAVVTHPTVTRAIARLAREAGGHVVIADNPSVPPIGQHAWQALYDRVGLTAVAHQTGAELNRHIVAQQRPHPQGQLIKLVDTSTFVTEADVIVNLPKLKTHGLMRFTGAVKNLFGTVPGLTKAGYHLKLQTVDRFADMLLDLVTFVRPVLTVMDAVVGMDGDDGPSGGDPFAIGAIVAGADPVLVDVTALDLVGHTPASVPSVAAAVRRGWTTGRVGDVTLLGDPLRELRVGGFRLPRGGLLALPKMPAMVRQMGTRYMVARPAVTRRCTGCGQCIQICPARAIVEADGLARIELSSCIRCYCCHELCPFQAIELRRPWLSQMLARVGR